MFYLKEFVKRGYISAVGMMPDYQIILGATKYFEKGVLDIDDLSDIGLAIDSQYSLYDKEDIYGN